MLTGDELVSAIDAWQKANLTGAALARVAIMRRGSAGQGGKISVRQDGPVVLERWPAHRDGPVVVMGENVELVQLAQPAGRVALDEQRLVVGARVAIRRAVAERCEDAPHQLVGGGDDGAFVAAAPGQGLVIRLELAVVGARGAVGALDEHGAQRLVATPGAPGTAFAGALVVAGTQAGPSRKAVGVSEHARVRSHLAQDGAGRRVVDAGEGLQQAARVRVGRELVVDMPVEGVHAPG